MLVFSSSESLSLNIPNQSVPLRKYLRQPQQLVNALMGPNQVLVLGHQRFRLFLRDITFFMLHVQPIVDLYIIADINGKLFLKSTRCEIKGSKYIDQHFSLTLTGYLEPIDQSNSTLLIGQADLKVEVEMPPILQITPKALVQATGNHVISSTLQAMKQRLSCQLSANYKVWNKDQKAIEMTKM
jgi:hypothetical protein